jgi:hypothetical protein
MDPLVQRHALAFYSRIVPWDFENLAAVDLYF